MKAYSEILKILNPVHLPTCDEWMRIVMILKQYPIDSEDDLVLADSKAFCTIQRFEELTRGKMVEKGICSPEINDGYDKSKVWQPALLTKMMFVCNLSELNQCTGDDLVYLKTKVWFEGFEKDSDYVIHNNIRNQVRIYNNGFSIQDVTIAIPTILDFIIELDRYNRTAEKKIEINWTQNFVELLK